MKTIVFVLLLTVLTACSTRGSNTTDPSVSTGNSTLPPAPIAPAPAPTPVQPVLSLPEEAMREAQKVFEQHYASCGDSYYCVLYGIVTQVKGVTFTLDQPSQLTQADSLNGVEFDGYATATSYLMREASNGKKWGGWASPMPGNKYEWHISVTKTKGRWTGRLLSDRQPVPCGTVARISEN